MQTVDWLQTIVFKVRKQWDYGYHVLIDMVNASQQPAFYTDRTAWLVVLMLGQWYSKKLEAGHH